MICHPEQGTVGTASKDLDQRNCPRFKAGGFLYGLPMRSSLASFVFMSIFFTEGVRLFVAK